MKKQFPRLLLLILLLVAAAGCGSEVTFLISVNPASSTVIVGTTEQFIVTGAANTAVIWQVNGITGGNSVVGTISTGGLYTAPALIPVPPVVTVTAIPLVTVQAVSVSVTIVGS